MPIALTPGIAAAEPRRPVLRHWLPLEGKHGVFRQPMHTLVIILVFGLVAAPAYSAEIVAVMQDPSQPLEVRPANGRLQASTKLSGMYWADGNGQASVEIRAVADGQSFPETKQARYKIQDLNLTVDIPYQRPSVKALRITLQIRGIKDLHGSDSSVFEGSCLLNPRTTRNDVAPSTGNTGAGTIPAEGKKPTTPAAGNGGDSNTDFKLSVADQAGQTKPGVISPYPPRYWQWLIWGNTAALPLAGVLVWYLWRRRRSFGSGDNSAHITQLQLAVESTKQALQDVEQRFNQANEKLKEQFSDSSPGSGTRPEIDLLGTTDELNRLIQAARVGTNHAATSASSKMAEPSVPGNKAGTDEKVASAINGWLADKERSRQELVQRAGAFGLKSQLASLKEAAGLASDPFEYMFEINPDGAWLWTPVPGNGEFCVAPVEASLLGMGTAPGTLTCLFEGMEKAGQGFRFEAIYRPCRLRRSGGKGGTYQLVTRGILQLSGNPPPAGSRKPPRLYTAEKTRTSQDLWSKEPRVQFTGGQRSTVGKALSDWIDSISTQVQDQSSQLTELTKAHQHIQASLPSERQTVDPDVVKKLSEQVNSLRVNINRLNNLTLDFPKIKDDLSTLCQKINAQTKPLPVPSALPVSYPEPNQPSPEPMEEQEAALASVIFLDSITARETAALPAEPVDTTAASARMFPGWENAWLEAAQTPGSRPEITDIPDPGLYALRLLNLRDILRERHKSGEISVVHLRILRPEDDRSGEVFELHETSQGNDNGGILLCNRCKNPSPWQFAVCIAMRAGHHAGILYPMGTYGMGNFSAGYSLLIDNPLSCFSIDKPDFAELLLKSRQTLTYEVRRRLSCSKPLATQNGRS